jgi:membrane protein required for colicin V production
MEALTGTIQVLDIVLAFIVLWGGYAAYQKGFIVELIETVTFVVTLGLLLLGVTGGLTQLDEYLPTGKFIKIAVLVLVYFIIVILLNSLSKWLQKKIDYSILDSLDNVAAFILGGLKYMIFLGVIVIGLRTIGIAPGKESLDKSYMYPVIIKVNEGMIELGEKMGLGTGNAYDTIKDWVTTEK